ncbi:MAG: hypothetical protein LBH81_03450, partial [Rickettsiales bacterium]|nr:hypothetical protein [Rickettsiales bacterium]
DLSANSKSNSIKQIDSAKFAQTGEVASRDNRAYMFAYVCEGVYWNDAPWTDCSGSEKVYNVPGCKDKNKGDKVDYHYTDNQGNPQVSKDVLCSFGVKYWYPATVGQDCPEFFRGVSG